jgi:hypothetical protein
MLLRKGEKGRKSYPKTKTTNNKEKKVKNC